MAGKVIIGVHIRKSNNMDNVAYHASILVSALHIFCIKQFESTSITRNWGDIVQ